MKEIVFNINSNEEIWDLIDKKFNHILIHKFNPNETLEWWNTDIRMKNKVLFENVAVRNMEFDISTDLNGLKSILSLNTNQLRIYQFDRPLPNTLSFDYLPENSLEKILLQNGLKHSFFCDFEFITISSSIEDFIKNIEENDQFKQRIRDRRNIIKP